MPRRWGPGRWGQGWWGPGTWGPGSWGPTRSAPRRAELPDVGAEVGADELGGGAAAEVVGLTGRAVTVTVAVAVTVTVAVAVTVLVAATRASRLWVRPSRSPERAVARFTGTTRARTTSAVSTTAVRECLRPEGITDHQFHFSVAVDDRRGRRPTGGIGGLGGRGMWGWGAGGQQIAHGRVAAQERARVPIGETFTRAVVVPTAERVRPSPKVGMIRSAASRPFSDAMQSSHEFSRRGNDEPGGSHRW